jgi:predicted TIM-barrel fold metal-dependent hydrolase
MKMDDMVIISVDDHISEPPDMFKKHLSGDALATAPTFHTSPNGADYWTYQGMKLSSVGLNAVVGRPLDEYGMEPQSLQQMRKGVYDPKARLDDMNVNGIAASLNFGSVGGFEGSRCYHRAPDKKLALTHLRAFNDWLIHDWCGYDRGRLIPCAILPTWDIAATVAEIKRVAGLGCYNITISDNPTKTDLPSIHNVYWEPMWKAIADNDITINLHIGSGNAAPIASMETPVEAWITTMPMSINIGAADWLSLDALLRYPDMRIALSESGIGWVPYFMERADFSHERHKAWTHSHYAGKKPSEVFRQHFMSCFIDDTFGLQSLAAIGEDNVAYECDYPHSDALWPQVPEFLWKSIQDAHLTDAQIDKITHGNAIKWLRQDLFKYHKHSDLTVGALRARAAADKVDTTLLSLGGAKPLAEGEMPRRVTSGDIARMMAEQAKAA